MVSKVKDIDALCEAIEKGGVQLMLPMMCRRYTLHITLRPRMNISASLRNQSASAVLLVECIYGAKAYPQWDEKYLTAET